MLRVSFQFHLYALLLTTIVLLLVPLPAVLLAHTQATEKLYSNEYSEGAAGSIYGGRGPYSAQFTATSTGGKLDDGSLRTLCDGQYMIVQPGRPALFCTLPEDDTGVTSCPRVMTCRRD